MEGMLLKPTVRGYFLKRYFLTAVFIFAVLALLDGALDGAAIFVAVYLPFALGCSYLQRRTTSLFALQDRVEYDTGIIRHKKQKIPIRMITDTSVESGFVDGLLGLCTIKINTSGGTGYEVELGLVDANEASAFHDSIYGRIEKSVPTRD